MGLIAKSICVAVLVAQTLGSLVAAVLILLAEPAGTVWERVPGVVVQALFIGTLASCLVAIPLGVVGGAVAGFVIRSRPHELTLGQWLARGFLSGAAIGGIGAAAYSVGMNDFSLPVPAPVLFFYLTVGVFTGALCGSLVGAWSCRVVRALGPAAGSAATVVGAG